MLKTKLNVLTLRKEQLPTVIFHEPEAIELCSTTPLIKSKSHAGYKVRWNEHKDHKIHFHSVIKSLMMQTAFHIFIFLFVRFRISNLKWCMCLFWPLYLNRFKFRYLIFTCQERNWMPHHKFPKCPKFSVISFCSLRFRPSIQRRQVILHELEPTTCRSRYVFMGHMTTAAPLGQDPLKRMANLLVVAQAQTTNTITSQNTNEQAWTSSLL